MIAPETFFGGAITVTTALSINLNTLLGRLQKLDFTNALLFARLPDARTMKEGGPHFLLMNCGSVNTIDLQDANGASLKIMAINKAYEIALVDNLTVGGRWIVQEWSITSGCATGESTLLYFSGGVDFAYPSGDPSDPKNRTRLNLVKTWRFNPADLTLTQRSNYGSGAGVAPSQALPEAATTRAVGRFFTHGSREESGGTAGDHKVFTPLTDTWAQGLVQPINNPPRQEFRVEDDGADALYHFGGETGGTWLKIFTTWQYRDSTDTWTQKADSSTSFKKTMCARALGEIFCAGWIPSLTYSTYCNDAAQETGYNQAYNPVTDSWRSAGVHVVTNVGASSESVAGRGNDEIHGLHGSAGRWFSTLAANTEDQGDGLDGEGVLPPPIECMPPGPPSLIYKLPHWDKYGPATDTWVVVKSLAPVGDDTYCQAGRAVASGSGPVSGGSTIEYMYQFGGMATPVRERVPQLDEDGRYMNGLNEIKRFDLVLGTEADVTTMSERAIHMGATAIC